MRDKAMFDEMIEHFGEDNIPNPNQYPRQFEFLTRSFEHYKKMKKSTEVEEEFPVSQIQVSTYIFQVMEMAQEKL
jgi:hypothetical protein